MHELIEAIAKLRTERDNARALLEIRIDGLRDAAAERPVRPHNVDVRANAVLTTQGIIQGLEIAITTLEALVAPYLEEATTQS